MAAVDAMAAALRAAAPGRAWVVATGALTNVAALFLAHPDLAAGVAGLSVMGGSVGGGFTAAPMGKVEVDGGGRRVERIGNWTPWAEFNVLIDPEAAASLFTNPVLAAKTTLVPLDLTHLVLATRDVQDLLLYGPPSDGGPARKDAEDGKDGDRGRGKSDLRVMLVELLNFFAGTYRCDVRAGRAPPPPTFPPNPGCTSR